MFEKCPYCLNTVIKKSDGTCPHCHNDLNRPPSQEILQRNKQIEEEKKNKRTQVDPYEKIGEFRSNFVGKRLIPSLLICIAGIVFSFIIKTGFIWIGAIAVGGIFFLFNVITYFSKIAELKIEIQDKRNEGDNQSSD